MKPGLVPGIEAELTFDVLGDMCPEYEGEVVHQVCATWTLIHFMEVAGRKILIDYLEPDEEGVGSHVSCDHIGPAAVGQTVRVVATVATADERELTCDMAAFRGHRLIASGRTVQKILPRAKLAKLLQDG